MTCNGTVSLSFGRERLDGACLGRGDISGVEAVFVAAAVSVPWGSSWSPLSGCEGREAQASEQRYGALAGEGTRSLLRQSHQPWSRSLGREPLSAEPCGSGGPSPGRGCLVGRLLSARVASAPRSREGGMPVGCCRPGPVAWVIKKKR